MKEEEENLMCHECGKCCRSYWIFTNVPEEVERFETLKTDKIEVIKIKGGLWKIMFHFPCNYLTYNNVSGKWYCTIYKKKRPTYCPQYPRNFLDEYKSVGKECRETFDNEVRFCPLLKKLAEEKGLL